MTTAGVDDAILREQLSTAIEIKQQTVAVLVESESAERTIERARLHMESLERCLRHLATPQDLERGLK